MRSIEYTLLFLFGFLQSVSAQQEGHEEVWDQLSNDIQNEERIIDWDPPLTHHYPVNRITEWELMSLHVLTPLQIREFLSYRKKYGDFISLMELQAIPNWDLQTVRKMIPLFTLMMEQAMAPDMKQRIQEGKHRLLYRTGGKFKTDSAAWIESSHLLSHRYQFRDLLQLGFTAEKDAGENKTPDHLSFYAGLGKRGILKKLMIGDYTVNMGQGLIHWQGYALGQSNNLVSGFRQAPIFKPHTGTDENRFHRGLAISIQQKKWELSAFLSRQKIDAGKESDSSLNLQWVSSLRTSGLHRTASEISGKKSLLWQSAGGRIRYQDNRHTTSLNFIYHAFGDPIREQSTSKNDSLRMKKAFPLLSMDHQQFSRWGFFFGEIAWKPGNSFALLSGWMKSLDAKLDLALTGRLISRQFSAMHTNSLTASGEAEDERGAFLSINYHPRPQHQFDGYIDKYQRLGPVYGTDGIRYGKSQVIRYKWTPNKKVEWYLQWNQTWSNRNTSIPQQKTNALPFVTMDHWRTHFSLKIDMRWSIRIRNEWSQLLDPGRSAETGQLHYAEIISASPLKAFSFSLRGSFFETGGYATRIYAYERDLLGYFSVPAHDGRGSRIYALMQYQWKNGHSISWKLVFDQRKGETKTLWRMQWVWEPGG